MSQCIVVESWYGQYWYFGPFSSEEEAKRFIEEHVSRELQFDGETHTVRTLIPESEVNAGSS